MRFRRAALGWERRGTGGQYNFPNPDPRVLDQWDPDRKGNAGNFRTPVETVLRWRFRTSASPHPQADLVN
jgi:hypothetical protein